MHASRRLKFRPVESRGSTSMGPNHEVNLPKKPVGDRASNPEKVNSTHYDWENNHFPPGRPAQQKGDGGAPR